jgi:hypothetical protein
LESPQTWDLLTSSLAVSNLRKTSDTWSFLVVQGLVGDTGQERDAFQQIVNRVLAEGQITGPSEALRVASDLFSSGIASPAASTPDPWGKIAESRLETLRGWRGSDVG